MDWTTPLRAQQADFIQRLKSGHLLHCDTHGQHSELTVISGERLKQLRDFCWEMAEKYKRTSPVRDVFINNLKGKLGEEVVKVRLGNIVTEVDYEQRLGGDGKVDFRLACDSSIGIQVKARHGTIDSVRWSITKEEIEQNAALVCILIQEEVNEAQSKYNLIMAGFLLTNSFQVSSQASFNIDELLYSGGLSCCLDFITSKNFITQKQETKLDEFKEESTLISDIIPNHYVELETCSKQIDKLNIAKAYYESGKQHHALKNKHKASEYFQSSAQLLCENNQSEDLAKWTPFELGESNREEAICYIKIYLVHGSSNEKRLAASAIYKLANRFNTSCNLAIPYLLNNLSDPLPQLRQYTLKALSVLNLPSSAVLKIKEIAENDSKEYNRILAESILLKFSNLKKSLFRK